MKPKALIFDIDDTLIQTIESVWKKFKYIGKQYFDIELTNDDIRPHWGKPLNECIHESLQKMDSPEKLRQISFDESEKFPIPAFPGAVKLIENLARKYYLGAVTSSAYDFIDSHMIKAGFDLNLFKFIQTADDTEFHKPDPRVFKPALEKLALKNINKEEVIYIGDSLSDFLAARDAGFNFIGLLTGLTTKEVFIENGVKEENLFDIVTDIEDIL